jgi:hypothetical protein
MFVERIATPQRCVAPFVNLADGTGLNNIDTAVSPTGCSDQRAAAH